MSQNYCPHCMRPATGTRCPHCGGDVSWSGQKGIDLPVGTVLAGGNGLRNYQIGAARGKGGFGITYIALETNSGRRMAIKEYFPTRCAFRGGNGVDVQAMTGQEEPFQSGMKSFLEEGRMLLAQDDLPGVVHVIDYFQANGTAYLVMEYLDGVALHAQMIRMGGRIPVSELMTRLAPLLRDIGQLHRRGVIHRDISPDNIMWMPDGGLKLLDFGSARSMETGKSMTVLMKQGFSPIEQYRSKGQGPYTDIYALAATIYYCVTGVIPPSSMERLGEDTLKSPIALGAALTVQQETALLWALSIQPNARPQSMEEFSAMLYKDRPVITPPGPVTTGGPYSVPPGPLPQSERLSQAPQGPATAQTPGYQYSPGYTGQTAGQGQVIGQGKNSSGGGGKSKLIAIGAAAVAVVVLIAVGFKMWNGGDTADTTDHTYSSSSEAPTRTEPPTPTVTPARDVVTGVTEDGFRYEIIDQSYAVLTGFEGSGDAGSMPDYIGDIPITEIADNAFAGVPMGNSILLPIKLETIGANAFRGCTDFTYVAAWSDVTTEFNSFSGCNNMWCVAVREPDVSGWKLPSGVSLYYEGMETGIGKLVSLNRSGGVLTGETDSDYIVLLDVRPGTETVTGLDDVEWICSWALDNLGYGATIELGEYTLYSYETLIKSSFTWSAPDGTLSDMWLLACKTARDINAARPSGATQMEPDLTLMQAAMIRAEEYAEVQDIATRPDGSDWSTVLGELNISYSVPMGAAGCNYSDYQKMWDEAAEYMAELYAPIDNNVGQYYSRVGMAVAPQSNGLYSWWGYVIIP